MKRFLLLAAVLLLFAPKAKGQTQIQSLPVDPATCSSSRGLLYYNTTLGIMKFCSGANVWSPFNSGAPIISPLGFGALWDVKFIYDATWTNSNGTITCTNSSECNFTSADLAKLVVCATSPNIAGGSLGNLQCGTIGSAAPTIIAVNGPNSITISVTPTTGCTPSSTQLCTLAWGTQDDTAAITAAANAAWTDTSSATGNVCKALVLPNGAAFISGPLFNQTISQLNSACGGTNGVAGSSGVDTTQSGPELYGQGPGQSVLIPLPNFNFAGCTFQTNACMMTVGNLEAHDFSINGLGQSYSGTPESVKFVKLVGSTGGGSCTGSTMFNVTLANYLTASTGSIGVSLGGACGNPYYSNNVVQMFGATTCEFLAGAGTTNATYVANACFGGVTTDLLIDGVGLVTSFGGQYQTLEGSGPVVHMTANNGATLVFNSFGDNTNQGNGTAASQTIFQIDGQGTMIMNLWGTNPISLKSTNTSGQVFLLNPSLAASSIHMHNLNITATGANNKIFNVANALGTVYDECGNTFADGSVASVFTGILIPCPQSIYPSSLQVTGFVIGAAGTGACSTITTKTGNRYNGSLTCTGTTGASTLTLTPGTTATNGWNCRNSQDITTPANTFTQNSVGTTTCVLTFATVTQNDVIMFNAQQF